VPGGTARNLEAAAARVTWDASVDEPARIVLADAQTSGGLLLAVPAENHEALLAALGRESVPVAATIGRVTPGPTGAVTVLAGKPI
jgi:selenide,water dikinase